MLVRVRVPVITNEVLAGGLVLPLGYCIASGIFTCTANADWVYVKLDTLKRPPERTLRRKWNARTEASAVCSIITCEIVSEKSLSSDNHPPNSHHQREDMHHPPLLGVVAQAFHQRLIHLLLSYGCR
jgi:hypothetical protein